MTIEVTDIEHLVAGAAAQCSWPPHYRYVTIRTQPEFIKNRVEWAPHLVHEIVHILTADLHDYLDETSPPKYVEVVKRDIVETTVSTVANVIYQIFMDAHAETIDKYLR